MFLKRLDVTGFKSFSGKSVLDFEKGNHVTAIVGPNGSGKSNIADSIRWVLGETSYKTVRAKKSEDVIFSGSNGKAKASFARVAMVLDNSDGKAPIDFSEVEIARSVYRDGSSEYLINGKKSRLLDVAELLAKSGFGQSTYSVIGQGMVDSMLFYGPAERKVLFDEAAGVRQYEMKREQTLRKLEDTHSNVTRAKDILTELNPRLGTLKRQAEKAKEKDVVKEGLLDKQKTYFATIWDKLSNNEKIKRSDLERLLGEESKVSEEIAGLNEAFNAILGKEKVTSSETEGIQKEINQLEVEKDALRQAIYTIRAKMELTFSAPTKKELEKRITEAKSLLSDVALPEKLAKKAEIATKLEEFASLGIRGKISEIDSKKDEIRQKIYSLRARIEIQSPESSLTKKEIEKKSLELEKEIRSLSIEDQRASRNQTDKELKTLETEIEKINGIIDHKKIELGNLSEQLSKFDFGVVNDRIGAVLLLQDELLSNLSKATAKKAIETCLVSAKKINEMLSELKNQVSEVKEGRISGMTELQEHLQQLGTNKERVQSRISELRSKSMELGYEINKREDQKVRLLEELERLAALKPMDEEEKKKIGKEITEHEGKIAEFDKEIESLNQNIAFENDLKNQINQIEYDIRREEDKKVEIEKEIARLENLKPADEGEKKELQDQVSEKELGIAKIDEEIKALRSKINERSSAFDEQGQKLSEIKDGLSAKQALVSEYGREITAIKIELARIETRKQDIREEINYEMGSEAALADAKVVPELDEEAARREIEKLKGKLYAIGEIDTDVEAEFEEVNSRVEFLSKQTEDLEKAKNDLEKLISELDTKIKKQFESSFSEISQKFTHFFTLLFDGGEAKLELVRQKSDEDDEEDRFGIEITAVPPGKKVKSLSALSGGERTLTSLALLFAILSVNPAPFCVLDEVDAALDENNTKRFLKIVHELAISTQFIFISHNRETMKEASVIYGITMDELHASKILSVKLTDALEVVDKKVGHPERA